MDHASIRLSTAQWMLSHNNPFLYTVLLIRIWGSYAHGQAARAEDPKGVSPEESGFLCEELNPYTTWPTLEFLFVCLLVCFFFFFFFLMKHKWLEEQYLYLELGGKVRSYKFPSVCA